jgi:hypothetical protein
MDDAKIEVTALHRLPASALAQNLVHDPLERVNKEIKRRSRVLGISRNPRVGDSARRRRLGRHARRVASRRPPLYPSEGSMALLYPERDTDLVAVTGTGE